MASSPWVRRTVVGPVNYFQDETAFRYKYNLNIIQSQTEMANRCIELLELKADDSPRMILDLGSGSGLSGERLDEHGHIWVGIDISKSMTDVAVEREVGGDLILTDMGNGLPFRAGIFDYAISVGVVQWLCNKDRPEQNPIQRLSRFFTSLYAVLKPGGRAVLQFYPADLLQKSLITEEATRAGFNGGVLIDFPESKKNMKLYLVLTVGIMFSMPKALTETPEALFHNIDEVRVYTKDYFIRQEQRKMAFRCIELLKIEGEDEESHVILDIGCGSGISGECLNELGHNWVGIDISQSMLNVALEREVGGDLVLVDMGEGLPFRAGTFDYVISVSALQWLCIQDKAVYNPVERLAKFFSTLYSVLKSGVRAVFQYYPPSEHYKSLVLAQATRAGFSGSYIVDYPESEENMTLYLVLTVGSTVANPVALKEAHPQSASSCSSNFVESADPDEKGMPA